MSAMYRSLARLPLSIFDDLVCEQALAPEDLRNAMCFKLRRGTRVTSDKKNGAITTVGELLRMSSPALLRATDPLLTHVECQEFIRRVCKVCSPEPTSALQLLHATAVKGPSLDDMDHTTRTIREEIGGQKRPRHLSSGMESLDKCLYGGFRVGTLTEIVGRAGVGKTNLGMQLCIIAAQQYGLGSVFIDTEHKLSLMRLKEMARFRGNHENGTTSRILSEQHVLENITVHSPRSTEELLGVVSNTVEEEILLRNEAASEETTFEKLPVGLVVLDSIAAPARRDFGTESAPQRVSAIFQVAQHLKRMADQLQLVVVVVNQVGLQRSEDALLEVVDTAEIGSDFVAVNAALGTSWHHCISTRLLLEHERDPHRLNSALDNIQDSANDHNENMNINGKSSDDLQSRSIWEWERGHIRKATVVKSNVAGRSSMLFEVTNMGLCQMNSTMNPSR